MAIAQHTVFPNVFNVFYNLLNKHISDPLNRGSQWIFASFPEEDISKGKVKYPILIIEPPDMSWETLTQTKSTNMIEIIFSAYSTKMAQADSLLTQINSVVDSNRWALKNDDGLSFVNLTGTSTDFVLRGGTRAHIRIATYSMQNIFVNGLAKVSRSATINSSGVIS